jgi:arylsulfatase
VRVDVGDDPNNPDINIAWKYMYTSKDTWLGPTETAGGIGSLYNLTMDPFEKYDLVFNGAVSTRMTTTSPGRYAGMDNGWALGLAQVVLMEFNKSIVDFPSLKRFPGGASNDQVPNLQNPANPVPLLDMKKPPKNMGMGG